MKHATGFGLNQLEDVLVAVRKHQQLKERKRGVLYFKSVAFLHFHEDPAGLFADLRLASDWEWVPVNTRSEKAGLLQSVKAAVDALSGKAVRSASS